jgi:hypothetical protein
VEVAVESFIIETDTSSRDFISYLESDFDFVEDSMVFEGMKGG